MTNDADIRIAKSIVDYVFRWFGKKFLTTDQQEPAGILSPEVKARLAQQYASASGDAEMSIDRLLLTAGSGEWRAAGSGFVFEIPEDPEGQVAGRQLANAAALYHEDLPHHWLKDDEPRLPLEWLRAAAVSTHGSRSRLRSSASFRQASSACSSRTQPARPRFLSMQRRFASWATSCPRPTSSVPCPGPFRNSAER
jgi:hypothetical protein